MMKREQMKSLGMILGVSILAGSLVGCGTTNDLDLEEMTAIQFGDLHTVTESTGNTSDQTEKEENSQSVQEVSGDESEEVVYEEIYSDEPLVDYEGVIVIGDTAYEVYNYRADIAEDYAQAVNDLAASLEGTAQLYDMVVPLSSGIAYPDNRVGEVNSSDQKDAIKQIFAMLDGNVKTIDIYDDLMKHRTEYIYFRTDHHWTALGAYYAYEQFCQDTGRTPESLDSYETVDFEGYLGSFYKDTDSDAALGNHPDVVTAYRPNANCTMHVTSKDDEEYDWPVILDVTSNKAAYKYSTFIGGDNPITVIENSDLTDGSACIVVKESFGNAFVPFLVDHYQTIYVIDYRYWKGSITSLAKEKGIQEVLLINNLSMIRNQYLVGQLKGVQ